MQTFPLDWPPAGHYILAISGGADSMALLDLFVRASIERQYQIVVAHFDHGLRPDSHLDREFVQKAAARYHVPFEYYTANLGQASEARSRTARYQWLEQVRRHHRAIAIITAHHRDDLIETSLLNLARGSGRRGLAPMVSTTPFADSSTPLLRPLIRLSRRQLRSYGAHHHLAWREDPTNADLTNPRNYLRQRLLSQADPHWLDQYAHIIHCLSVLNQSIDAEITNCLQAARLDSRAFAFPRSLIRDLSLSEVEELLVSAAYELDPHFEPARRLIQEVALFAKTSRPHRRRPLSSQLLLSVATGIIRLERV